MKVMEISFCAIIPTIKRRRVRVALTHLLGERVVFIPSRLPGWTDVCVDDGSIINEVIGYVAAILMLDQSVMAMPPLPSSGGHYDTSENVSHYTRSENDNCKKT